MYIFCFSELSLTGAISLTHVPNLSIPGNQPRMPPPNITVPPNTAQRPADHFSSPGSQLPNTLNINMNLNQGQFNQTQANRTGPTPVSLQQHLQQTHFNNLNASLTSPADASAIPTTLSGISLSQFNSSLQNHTQMSDAFKSRQISVRVFVNCLSISCNCFKFVILNIFICTH